MMVVLESSLAQKKRLIAKSLFLRLYKSLFMHFEM